MFMFWSKRAVLTRRLLKAKVRGEHETECETQEDTFTRINVPNCSNNGSTTSGGFTYNNAQQVTTTTHQHQHQHQHQQEPQRGPTTRAQQRSASVANRGNSVANRFHQGCCGGDLSHDEDDFEHHRNRQHQRNQPNRLTRCKELLKSLKDNQLEMLLNVVESYGADFGSCVLVPRNKYNTSPCRLSPVNKQNSPPSSPIISPKKQQQQQQQQESMVQCNRHQRCGLASSLHENPTTRRIPHRHLLRSRRNHGGSRCSRCVSCHGEEQRGVSMTTAQRDELSCSTDDDITETRDNEMNLRVVDSTNANSGDFMLEDLRQEQPAWSGDSSNFGTMGVGQQTGEACGSRPERDRCRRGYGKISRTSTTTTATTGTRKRRDSPPSGEASSSESSIDGALDDPHLLSCQIWRWPDLVSSSELKKLPVCHSAKDPVYTCCNPYHWSRLCKPESPPPPYCLIPDRLRPEDRAPSERSGDYRRCGITTSPPPHSGSLTTNGEGGGEMGQKEWCTLAYWELGGRVGRLYPVEPSTVNVFDSLHDGDGLCLATLSENHPSSPAVQRTRSKIGLGLMLSQETDGVWAYNRSDSPIFVNSPTLDDPESRTLLVYRVPPGFCLNIFDRSKTMQLPRSLSQNSPTSASFNSGPVDVNSVRISFAKGWGPKYSRQEVTSCPCWLEVLLAPCR